MSYPALQTWTSESECRAHFEAVYCTGPIATFDGILVRFRKSDFDHCFFESTRRDGVKDLFSIPRSSRIDWIKTALEDVGSDRYVGWDKQKKNYDKSRRVAVVMGDYVVIISIKTDGLNAMFITAYVADNSIAKITSGPKWV